MKERQRNRSNGRDIIILHLRLCVHVCSSVYEPTEPYVSFLVSILPQEGTSPWSPEKANKYICVRVTNFVRDNTFVCCLVFLFCRV